MSIFKDNYGDLRMGWLVSLIISGFFVMALIVGAGLRTVDRHLAPNACLRYAEETNRQTKFVDYTFWTYDCLTPSGDGQWISVNNIYKEEK